MQQTISGWTGNKLGNRNKKKVREYITFKGKVLKTAKVKQVFAWESVSRWTGTDAEMGWWDEEKEISLFGLFLCIMAS